MSQQSDVVSGACLDVDLSSPAPAEPGRIALPHPSDDGAHVLGDGIAAAGGGDSEALILMAGGVNEASQVWGNQTRPSSSEFTLGPSVNYSSSSDYSVKVLFDGSSPNAGGSSGSTSANGGPAASVQPPVFRGAFPLNRHANEGNYGTPVRHTNFRFPPQSQVGGNWGRFNSDNGRYRNQRHHERGVHLWNGPPVVGTNPGIRMPMQPLQGHGQPFVSPSAFMLDQTQPFASLVCYADGTSPYSYSGIPPAALETYYAPSPPVLETYYVRPSPHPPQQLVLKQQIEYYFSVDNLCRDSFLRSNMDAQGWVPISLIATFRRVKRVTSNTNYILSALRSSIVIEIQGENIRRHNDWKRWILPSANGRDGQPSGSTASASNYDSVVGDSSRQIVTASN
ncbi:la-related protein 1B-like [Zingiber officinale]|uniref:HTH La-type RNA-binding domain-containing protein n=1 Tax=Zingiber officinale TaxID=94328 RepID=A0A8J5EZW9_ZINOF|nr:la-related protein 1B-like [Zingiber officinale]KAG6475738.1 hypothetical protein ZIOFF_064967 [Zingiber officinale]